jgi:hypothetical protein
MVAHPTTVIQTRLPTVREVAAGLLFWGSDLVPLHGEANWAS